MILPAASFKLSRFSKPEQLPSSGGRGPIVANVRCLPYGLPAGTDQPKTFAIWGGLGDVTARYLSPGFARVQSHFPNDRFIIVDKLDPGKPEEAREIGEKKSALGFPLAEAPLDYLPDSVFSDAVTHSKGGIINIAGKQIKIDGAILALPPNLHFEKAKILIQNGILTGIEKPLALPTDLELILKLDQWYPGKVFPIDYMLASDSYVWMVAANSLPRLVGDISKVAGRIVEKQTFLPSRKWLLQPQISGGGAGIDIFTHTLAATSLIVGGYDHASIEGALLGRYDIEAMPPGPAETYMWLKMLIAGNIQVLLDGGCGVANNYEGLTVTGNKGTLEIFNGIDTEQVPPFVRHSVPGQEDVFYLFPDGDLGYGRTWIDFEMCARPELWPVQDTNISHSVAGFDSQTRLKATSSAVAWIKRAYDWFGYDPAKFVKYQIGQTPTVPEPVPGNVDQARQLFAQK